MITIWPQYLDKKLTLSEGRKISKENAVSSPTIEEIERSLKRLGYTYEVQKKIAYPGKWYSCSVCCTHGYQIRCDQCKVANAFEQAMEGFQYIKYLEISSAMEREV